MANAEAAKSIFDSTSGKIYFILKNVFDSEDEIQSIMTQTYSDVFAASENPTDADIFFRTAAISFGKLGKPYVANSTDFPINKMHEFFDSCENFNKTIPNEAISAIGVLNTSVSMLDPISKLIVFLRMFTGMSPAEIASLAGTTEDIITVSLFTSYRTIMPAATQTIAGTPSLQKQPMLQLIRIALFKQAFNTSAPADVAEKLFPSQTKKPAPVTEDAAFVSAPIINSYSDEWSYVKNKFGFDVSDDANQKFSKAYTLISEGRTDSAKEILFSINREAPHAASLLGLLMIDVGALTPDDMFNIAADYANIPYFKGASNFANSQLKDFLNKLLAANAPATPAVQTVQQAEPKTKKNKKGLVITVVILVLLLAAGGGLALALSQGWISLPTNTNEENTSEVDDDTNTEEPTSTEENTTEEPSVTQPSIPQINLGTTTVIIDRAVDNNFEFIPTQSGYYTFSSAADSIDLDGTLFSAGNRIATDTDSDIGQNFMLTVYCDAGTPFMLSVTEKAKGSGEISADISVIMRSDSEGTAYAKYSEYTTNGINLTTSSTLYFDHSFDSNSTMPQQEYIISPTDFYIDESEGILWLAFPSEYNGQAQTLWHPVRY